MEMFLIVILLPELLMIAMGLAFLVCSFAGNGDLARIKITFALPRKQVESEYWGSYANVAHVKGEPAFVLPKIVKPREADAQQNWTGKPLNIRGEEI